MCGRFLDKTHGPNAFQSKTQWAFCIRTGAAKSEKGPVRLSLNRKLARHFALGRPLLIAKTHRVAASKVWCIELRSRMIFRSGKEVEERICLFGEDPERLRINRYSDIA